MSLPTVTQFLLDCALVRNVAVDAYDLNKQPQELLAAAKHYGIDVEQVRAEMKGEQPPPSTAARAPKKAKTSPATKKSKKPLKVAEDNPPLEPELAGAAGEDQTDDAGFAGEEAAEASA